MSPSDYRYQRERKYYSAEAVLENAAPALLRDPDIAAALATIRNAERAVAARIEELDPE